MNDEKPKRMLTKNLQAGYELPAVKRSDKTKSIN